ncbi:L-type lectin-domain containing receptor kinase IX.1-like [Macadamia integrifolia]|uniref:L-type lectin-domain containing receptor kinase IX.1-like n=1 Tax=Macadamia integrifolia TaxID=60698 RepID=UPI001C4E7C27|nr:L-type lectin-domain containing receptor kinase IX.1-like [Macadamia integrifolia]
MANISSVSWHFQFPKLNFILFQISLYFLLLVPPPAISLSFNFPSFNYSLLETPIIVPQLDAELSGTIIDLTRNNLNQSSPYSHGGVLYNAPVPLWDKKKKTLANFTTHFSFTISESDYDKGGDGLTFFLAPYGFQMGGNFNGGGLGLFYNLPVNNTATNRHIVAVEFDTYQNYWDPDSNHIGIDIYSIVSVQNTSCDAILWNKMTVNAEPWEATVDYDSSSYNLSVILSCSNKSVSPEICGLNYVVNLSEYLPEEVTSTTEDVNGVYQLNSWDFSSSLEMENSAPAPAPAPARAPAPVQGQVGVSTQASKRGGGSIKKKIGMAVGGASMITVLGSFLLLFFRRRNNLSDADDDVVLDVPTGPREFSYAELAGATSNFDDKQKLGEGGFGGVYKGFLSDLKMDVAVKRISKGSRQGIKEYSSEVKIISRLRHRNLVHLVSWCHQRKELLLVYEFMSNGSLDSHLFQNRGSLTWELRYKIALDLASALQYLRCPQGYLLTWPLHYSICVVHRDIKSSNVILDSKFNAKLGDFGLARLVENEGEPQTTNIAGTMGGRLVEQEKGTQTTNVAGTMGYMAPEYVLTGKASKESDVYSFGIVLLEIACGRKPVERMANPSEVGLVGWVWELYGSRKHLEATDPCICMDSDVKKQVECMIVVGLWCAQQDYNLRPSIGQAINVLKFDAPLPILPCCKVPVFSPFQ